ncbi:MAG: AraC family transcriptional regulator, partial [Geobacter sp.]
MTEPLSQDQAFIRKLADIVSANLQDENFGVEKLVRETGISRVTIHRKVKSIKHLSISQFIREIRLHKAMEMLQSNEGTAAEIAFRVGFGSATYFNKCFHEYFGYS